MLQKLCLRSKLSEAKGNLPAAFGNEVRCTDNGADCDCKVPEQMETHCEMSDLVDVRIKSDQPAIRL